MQALKERYTSAKGKALCQDIQNTSSEGALYNSKGQSPLSRYPKCKLWRSAIHQQRAKPFVCKSIIFKP